MDGKIIQGIEVYDTVDHIRRRNRVAQKKFLSELEMVLGVPEGKNQDTFEKIRKLYLDSVNAFARDVVNIDLFGGEIER